MADSTQFDRLTREVFARVEQYYLSRNKCQASQETINFIGSLQQQRHPSGWSLYDLANTLLVIVMNMDEGKLKGAEKRALSRQYNTSQQVIWEVYYRLFVPFKSFIAQATREVFDTYSSRHMQEVLLALYNSQASGVSTKPGKDFRFYVLELVIQAVTYRIIGSGMGKLTATWSQQQPTKTSVEVPTQKKAVSERSRPAFDRLTQSALATLVRTLPNEECHAKPDVVNLVRKLATENPDKLHMLLVRLNSLSTGWNYHPDLMHNPKALKRIGELLGLTPKITGQIYQDVLGGLVSYIQINPDAQQLTQALVELYYSSQEVVRRELTGENYQFMDSLITDAIVVCIIKTHAGELVSKWLHIPNRR